MLNLLRFRAVADYSGFPQLAPSEPISGSEAFDRYVRHTMPFLEASGGSVEFFGTGGYHFVGPPDERWDLVMLIRQASIDDFFAFASNDAYLAGTGHRIAHAGLEAPPGSGPTAALNKVIPQGTFLNTGEGDESRFVQRACQRTARVPSWNRGT